MAVGEKNKRKGEQKKGDVMEKPRSILLDGMKKRLTAKAVNFFDGQHKHKYNNVPMAVWLMDSNVQPHDYAKGKRLLFKIPLSEAESHEKEIQRVPSVLEIDIFLDEKEAKDMILAVRKAVNGVKI